MNDDIFRDEDAENLSNLSIQTPDILDEKERLEGELLLQEDVEGFTWKSFFMETLQTIVLALILYFIIDTAFARVRVDNISMIPTLKPGEFLLVNKMTYRFKDVERGDIIVFHAPVNPGEDYIKRAIGLPGDHIRVDGGKLYINDQPLTEPYLTKVIAYEGSWDVPDDALFVLGDNRNQSSDSHSWGFLPLENVVGKALFIYWPFDEATGLKVSYTN